MKNLPKAPHSTQETKHTPTPKLAVHHGEDYSEVHAADSLHDNTGFIIREWGEEGGQSLVDELVRRSNAHDDLVAALTTALSSLKSEKEAQGLSGFENVWRKEYAALAKASGEAA